MENSSSSNSLIATKSSASNYNSSAADSAAKAITDSAATFTKEYLVKGGRFSFLGRAILKIVLKSGKQYTLDQAEKLIKQFKEGI